MIMHTRHVPGLAVLLAAVLLPLSCSKDSPPEAPPRAQPESVRDTSGQPPAPVAETETPPAPVAKSGPPARKVPEPPEGREVRPPEPVLPGGEKTPPPPKAEPGLRLEVGPGKPPVDAPQREKQADAKRLSDADAAKVLARLPKLVEEAGDAASFAFRKRSLPPPRTGETVKTAFPPQAPADATRPDGGTAQPLEVVRFAPEGDVKLAPHLSVTFSQPMVAVTSHEEVKGDLPVAFSPKVEGKWRWVGTQTILFEPTKRFPMASELTVTVPKGTTSKSGGVLAGDVTWTFRTPPPRVIGGWPTGGPHGLDPVFFMELDQHVDPKKVLETVVVTAGWSKVPIRLATEAETKAGNPPPMVSDEARKGRWVAFRAESALPKDKSISVKVGPGTPSEEGPRKTEEAHTWSFRTFGPFRVEEKQCGWRRCPPMHPFTIRMSNPFDAEAFDAEQVSVEPKVEGLNVSVSGQYLHVRGLTKGRTKYTVTLDKGIVDSFGQALGENERVVFEVGEADPWMAAQGGVFVVLDPQSGPTYPIYTVNERRVELTLYRVGPEDWEAYKRYARTVTNSDPKRRDPPPGKKFSSRTVRIEDRPDEMIETQLDLAAALGGEGYGHVVVEAVPDHQPDKWYRRAVVTWVQRTRIAVDGFRDGDEMYAWATGLLDGAPAGGTKIEMFPGGETGTTGDDGLCRIPFASKSSGQKGSGLLVARRGSDVAILPEDLSFWSDSSGWYGTEASPHLRWFVFDDRQLYRVGETVSVKGWIRRVQGGDAPDIEGLGGGGNVSWRLTDSRGNEVRKGSAKLNALGGFHLTFDLPDEMNLGHAYLNLSTSDTSPSGSHSRYIQVQEFRRPEFEVKAETSGAPHFVGGEATVSLHARYFAGGGLPATKVWWRVTSRLTSYTPPNRWDYAFGSWVPWWESGDGHQDERTTQYEGTTDAEGKDHVKLKFLGVEPPRPASVRVQGTVQDVNRQSFAATANLLVHPADLYVGVRAKRAFVEAGKPLDVELIAVDLDGKAVPGRSIDVRAVRLEWVQRKGTWTEEEKESQSCKVSSAENAAKCTFRTAQGGTYKVTADIVDDKGRSNQTSRSFWVSGGQQPTADKVTQEQVTLIPDRKEYQPGDTAEVLVQAPFAPAEGLLTVRVHGILRTERFRMEGQSHTLKLPIEERHIPNVTVQVDLAGAAPRLDASGEADPKLPKRPAYARGALGLEVPAHGRTLQVKVEPAVDAIEPGGETTVEVTLKDAAGNPVEGADVALVVVDEAVLALTGYRVPDPIGVFYLARGYHGNDYYLRQSVLLVDPTKLEASGPAPGGEKNAEGLAPPSPQAMPAPPAEPAKPKAADEAGAGTPDDDGGDGAIKLRTDFNPLATFEPELPTGAGGTARVTVKLPDNLTRYRIVAVAAHGGRHFGLGESALTARLPLMVRPSAPRFLNFGDRFELPVVLQNQTGDPMSVDVAVASTGVSLTEGTGRRLTVPANDRVEVRFPAAVARAGTGRLQIGAVSGKWADAAKVDLPIWTPATTEAFATYGTMDEPGAVLVQPVKAPGNVVRDFGGLEVTTSSTALQALTDAVLYLVSYPYDCAEQRSSRLLAVAALKDVLGAFQAKGLPPPKELLASVDEDIRELRKLQNGDGGFAFWQWGSPSWPYISVHVAHALVRAQMKGFEVQKQMLERSRYYLRDIERRFPHFYPADVRRTITAYSLYVRALMGDPDPAKAGGLVQQAGGVEKMSLDALGWLIPVLGPHAPSAALMKTIRRHVANRSVEDAGNAHFVTEYDDGAHLLLHSDRKADGILLEAMIGDQPDDTLIPKVVRGLLAHRTRGRWGNTQENAFVLLALDRYFATYEKQTPDFVARIWLGDGYAGDHEFKGRTTERHQVDIPMAVVAEKAGEQPLTIAKDGKGRLYYRIGMRYAPSDLVLEPADHGFVVERKYAAVDDSGDVSRDGDGTWRVKAGARVRVRLTMVSQARRYHVALTDPLPAGLEALNPALEGTEDIPPDAEKDEGRQSRSWWGPWYEHQNLRDERVEAFASLLWSGVYTYEYVARATTPGRFVVPPTKAEEMYSPETFGRTGTDVLVVQ